jgi:hypothetical protein
VGDLCEGLWFDRNTVLSEIECCIPCGIFSSLEIGGYIMPYYVHEVRIMYGGNEDSNRVYGKHLPIFENICGFIGIGTEISKKKEIVCVHGNIAFKGSNAIFKGVRNVGVIKKTIGKVLGREYDETKFEAFVNMAVVTACLGKSSLVGSSGSLLETSLIFTQGEQCIGLVAKTEGEKNMVKVKVLDWDLLMKQSIEQVLLSNATILSPKYPEYLTKYLLDRGTSQKGLLSHRRKNFFQTTASSPTMDSSSLAFIGTMSCGMTRSKMTSH